MMNIKSAINQMRVARNLGKISATVQTRTLRRLGYAPLLALQARIKAELDTPMTPEWEQLIDLRNSIATEVEPILEATREAEADCFQIKFTVTPSEPVEVKQARPVRKLEGYEYTPAWWKDAEKRERDARKAGLIAD